MDRLLPKTHQLHQASKELVAAEKLFEELREYNLKDFDIFEVRWREFLQKLERAWNKIQAGMAGEPNWKKLESEIEWLRKTDPLLRFLRQARNADEHSIQALAGDWNANPRVSRVTRTSARLEWNPWGRPLLPVTNRGVAYQPPKEHLGEPVRNKPMVAEPVVVAELGLKFYTSVLDRAIVQVGFKG